MWFLPSSGDSASLPGVVSSVIEQSLSMERCGRRQISFKLDINKVNIKIAH